MLTLIKRQVLYSTMLLQDGCDELIPCRFEVWFTLNNNSDRATLIHTHVSWHQACRRHLS